MTFAQVMERETGYKCITTFWEDFSIADRFGVEAVKDTYRRAKREWGENVKYFAELVIVLNQKIWWHYRRAGNDIDEFANTYNDLWNDACSYATEHFHGEDLEYYYTITD